MTEPTAHAQPTVVHTPALPEVLEHGRAPDGTPLTSDRRLWIQLLVFDQVRDVAPLIRAVAGGPVRGAVYADLNHPLRVGLLTASTEPTFFVEELRTFLLRTAWSSHPICDHWTMVGRTYAVGYEPDLEAALIHRPLRRICHREWPWAIWYPLRRRSKFERLPPELQRDIMKEHAELGQRWSEAGEGYDIRLLCHGLDQNDNDFVIGLVGPRLASLSAMVRAMRKTRQTSTYLERLGPFFVGRVLWQSDPTI
jgi:chlorite dismutase